MADELHARYLSDPDTGHVELVPKEDVKAKREAGWKDPEVLRANGYEYNREEDQLNIDAAGEMLTQRREWEASEAKRKEDLRKAEQDKADAAQKKAEADAKPEAPKAVAPAPAAPASAPAPPAAS